MGNENENTALTITAERAVELGAILGKAIDGLQALTVISRENGDLAASFARVVKQRALSDVLAMPEIEALIISAAGDGYEVAESDKFKFTPEQKFHGARKALMKGYLLSDEHGPHFTVIVSKGGVSTLIKEVGHRYKLRKFGAKNIQAQATARGIRQRPNAEGKADCFVEGFAQCEINGEVIRIERKGDAAMCLPCYPTDGPDAYEGKGKRRLIRDLWERVSGNFEPIELDELDEVEPVEVVPPVAAITHGEQPEPYDDSPRGRMRSRLAKKPDTLALIERAWSAVEAAASIDEIEAIHNELKAQGKYVSLTQGDVKEWMLVFESRKKELQA